MKYTVLITDDSKLQRVILKENLKDIYDVAEASCGQECLDLVENSEGKIDVVLLDIVMPGMDGMETCEKLRQRYPEANVFMVSSMAYDDMIDRAVELGAKGFLFKPFTKDALLEGLQGAFKAIESEREKA